MANWGGYGQNQGMINQLMRQKENIDNMIQQYSQPPTPVQNIINTGLGLDFEARILKDGEEIENILINRKTMFLDKKNKKLYIKEVDGSISEEYEIVVPLDEKDKKILELEKKIKEMEENEHSKSSKAVDGEFKPDANDDEYINTTTKTNSKSISKSTK